MVVNRACVICSLACTHLPQSCCRPGRHSCKPPVSFCCCTYAASDPPAAELLPPKPRPKTSAAVARRLIGGALNMRLRCACYCFRELVGLRVVAPGAGWLVWLLRLGLAPSVLAVILRPRPVWPGHTVVLAWMPAWPRARSMRRPPTPLFCRDKDAEQQLAATRRQQREEREERQRALDAAWDD